MPSVILDPIIDSPNDTLGEVFRAVDVIFRGG